MMTVSIAVMVIAIAAIVAGVTAASANHAKTKALKAAPDRRLGNAVRVLDQTIQAHESGMAMLPEQLLKEAQEIVTDYYTR